MVRVYINAHIYIYTYIYVIIYKDKEDIKSSFT